MESHQMKYSQIQIKECVDIIIRNFQIFTEAPHASGLLPADKIILTYGVLC